VISLAQGISFGAEGEMQSPGEVSPWKEGRKPQKEGEPLPSPGAGRP